MAETITRRGLLGMFAAGAAAAVLPSGIIMPVRKIVVPAQPWVGVDRARGLDLTGITFEVWTKNGRFVEHRRIPAHLLLGNPGQDDNPMLRPPAGAEARNIRFFEEFVPRSLLL